MYGAGDSWRDLRAESAKELKSMILACEWHTPTTGFNGGILAQLPRGPRSDQYVTNSYLADGVTTIPFLFGLGR